MRVQKMRWTGVVALGFVLSGTQGLMAQAAGANKTPPVKDDLFVGTEKFAQGATSVTQIDMDPDSLGLVGGSNGPRAHQTVLNVVHTYSYDKPGMYKMEDVEGFRKKLETGDWHCSVHVREFKTGESTDICNRRRTDEMVESAIITVSPKSLTFIHTIRKRSGTGQSDLSDFMPMHSLEGLSSLAIVGPDLSGLSIALGNVHMPEMDAMRGLRVLDSAALQRRLNEAQKNIERSSQQVKEMKQMKELQVPDMQKKIDELQKLDGAAKDVP